ncbi:MAG: radical SAM protein [Dehalococcoidales bacterium]|nr:radical SAM protein [Dehalococcoidales bacterium]
MSNETQDYIPPYIALYRSGELAERAEQLEARLTACDICPRNCGVNRLEGEKGFCNSAGLPCVSNVLAHHGEEPVLSGYNGSGTVFFGNCNMRCLFCQNFQISQSPETQQSNEIQIGTLAEKFLYIQDELKCHNINLVSPTHFVPQIVKALVEAVPEGLHLPLVYNTGGYDSLETVRLLDGIISIYLPDLKYSNDECSAKYSLAPDYVKHSRAAIREMYRQVGDLRTDSNDIAKQGLIVRHLILPNRLAGSEDSLRWLAEEISSAVTVSIMSQYHPIHKARNIPELSRPVSISEYEEVVNLADKLGLENGWIQEMESNEYYLPDFNRKDNPFEDTLQDRKP